VCHASVGLHKLYRTGAFFFIMSYSGSNFRAAAALLAATHTKQSHWGGNADMAMRAGGSGGSGNIMALKDLSVLGVLLPEALILLLEEKGSDMFAEIFTGDCDTPCVIWT